MSIQIKEDKCVACGQCIRVCPGSLIKRRAETGKAYMKYEDRCWGCVSCVKACHTQAISFFLGADIGGQGATMTVDAGESELHWLFEKADGSRRTITIRRSEANKY